MHAEGGLPAKHVYECTLCAWVVCMSPASAGAGSASTGATGQKEDGRGREAQAALAPAGPPVRPQGPQPVLHVLPRHASCAPAGLSGQPDDMPLLAEL